MQTVDQRTKASDLLNPLYLYQRRDRIIPRLHQLVNRWGIPVTPMDRRLAGLKDHHQGRRGFIIGTGPSLRVADLDRLKSEITFGCNKIYLAFGQTDWRPTYYSVLDVILAEQNRAEIRQLNLNKIFSCWVQPHFSDDPAIIWLRHIGPAITRGIPDFKFSTNALEGVHGGWTVIYTQLQLAYYMGIREVYLLGVDFYFNTSRPTGELSINNPVLEQDDEINHFHAAYRARGEKWTMPRLDFQRQAFLCAKQTFEANGATIYNASRQTALDVFPRIEFDKLMAG